ncbi:MAG: helix-turn-helix transcriptional regulator [bacterium]|nr:helix-turn-helix transcriptional regulator [bacterium]
MELKEISKRLKTVRKSLEKTQQEFADEVGLSKGFISKIEAGIQQPSAHFLSQMSETYDISVDWLLFGYGEMIANPGNDSSAKLTPELEELRQLLDSLPDEKQKQLLKGFIEITLAAKK